MTPKPNGETTSTEKASTPGPWRCDSYRFVRQVEAPQHVICRLPTQYNAANQRLIAAAPDMLSALKLAIRTMVEAAVEAETGVEPSEALIEKIIKHCKADSPVGIVRVAIAKAEQP